MTNTVSSTRVSSTHKIVVTAMLSAVAFALMFIEVPIPALIPSFVKMDISDLPALLGAFALGPVCGSLLRAPPPAAPVSCATSCWVYSLWCPQVRCTGSSSPRIPPI